MKNYQELKDRLKMELNGWFTKQIKNPFADYYLYYLESTSEHDGGIIICENQPSNPEFKLAWPQRINKGATIEQNFNQLCNDVLGKLPVLSA